MGSRAWADLSIKPVQTKSEQVNKRPEGKAEVFDLVKQAFESGNPDEIRDEVTVEMLTEMMT